MRGIAGINVPTLSERQLRRFVSKIEKTEKCWDWVGTKTAQGYGQIWFNEQHYLAYRISYWLHRGSIPAGMTLDHLCRNRLCVNPDHLEAVTNKQNILRGQGYTAKMARKTVCKWGHPLDLFNTYIKSNGHRHCRICKNIGARRIYAARKPK